MKAQSLLNHYLWKGRKARCTFSKLILTRNVAGHVVIKDYHRAAILTQLKGWFLSANNTLWADLQCSQIPGDNLYTFILTHSFSKTSHSLLSPTIKAAIVTWQQLLDLPSEHTKCTDLPLPILVPFIQWETDFGATYLPSTWQKALSTTYALTKSTNLWELTQKIMLRLYLTPHHIAKFTPQTSSEFWRPVAVRP